MEDQSKKKPQIKGQVFLQRVGHSLAGDQNPGQSPETDAERYEAQTRAVEAQDRYNTALDKAKNPPSVVEALTQDKKEAQERAKEAEERERARAAQDKEEADRKAAEAKQQAEAAEIAKKQAEDALKAEQNRILLEKIEELKGSQKPIQEQFQEYFSFAQTLAEQMGFQRPGTGQPQSENPQIALEIAKINAESAQRDREFQLQMEESKRKWDIELMKLKDGQDIERAKIAQQAERDKALMQAPQIIGAALAQGLLDQAKGGGVPQQVIQSSQEEPLKIQAAPGDAGEIPCPYCHTPMAIGPTSVITKCVGCNREYPIVRVALEEPVPKEEK